MSLLVVIFFTSCGTYRVAKPVFITSGEITPAKWKKIQVTNSAFDSLAEGSKEEIGISQAIIWNGLKKIHLVEQVDTYSWVLGSSDHLISLVTYLFGE